MKFLRAALAGVTAALVLTGCGGGGGSDSKPGPTFPSTPGQPTTFEPNAAFLWPEILALPHDTRVDVLENSAGTTVYRTPMILRAAFADSGNHVFSLQPAVGDRKGPGNSGSPVILNGKLLGPIFAGYDESALLGQSFDQQRTMYDAYLSARSAKSNSMPAARSWPVVWNVRGVPDSLLQKARGQSFGGRLNILSQRTAAASPVPAAAAAVPPQAGRMYAGKVLDGPDASLYFGATYTTRIGKTGLWHATGHPIDGVGMRDLMVSAMFVDFRLQNGSLVGHPIGSNFGSMVWDGLYGSILNAARPAQPVAVTTLITWNGQRQPAVVHQLARDRGSDIQQFGLYLAWIAPLYNRLLASGRTVSGTVTITVQYEGEPKSTYRFTSDPVTPDRFISDLSDYVFQEPLAAPPRQSVMSSSVEANLTLK